MNNFVTVITEDNWIDVDGETIYFEEPIAPIPEHTNLFALYWKNNQGEYQIGNLENSFPFTSEDYDRYVQPYVDMYNAEKSRVIELDRIRQEEREAEIARQEELERIRQKQREDEYNRKYNVERRVRDQRDLLLAETDKYLLLDYPIANKKLEEILEYRQALRDVSNQEGWPRSIIWPVKPKI